ncbi:MAG: hypothetical protein WKF91_12160 [Segetibacter sp.]
MYISITRGSGSPGKRQANSCKDYGNCQPGSVFFTGDLNGGRDSEWYQTLATSGLLTDVFTKVTFPCANNLSMNGLGHYVAEQ